jgi:hypothetical protein
MADKTCASCRFMFTESPFDRSYGQCRRFPPTYPHPDISFPEICDKDWCGEHQPKEPNQ